MLYLFILLFIPQCTILLQIIKCIVKNRIFLLLWGLNMQMKMSFLVLECWLFGNGKVLEIFVRALGITFWVNTPLIVVSLFEANYIGSTDSLLILVFLCAD